MDRRVPLQKRKYLKKDSDRSGFTYFRKDLVKDGVMLVHPDEKDEPAPTPHFIGGEGERGSSDARSKALRESVPATKSEITDGVF